MVGRRLCSEQEAIRRGFDGVEMARRREVLRETILALEQSKSQRSYYEIARRNLGRWRAGRDTAESTLRIAVFPDDWGDITLAMTKEHGACFAVLNMANAYVPGGAYVEGAIAQEENMYRRSDCHFRVDDAQYDAELDRYRSSMTRLLMAQDGLVYLDTQHPRVCIRGPEDRARHDLGYRWLPEDQIFPFYELRSAAQDLRNGANFDPNNTRRRIKAQLVTLQHHRIRHVVFGAFGCGAFRNPAHLVAQIYLEEIMRHRKNFSMIAFAVFHAGYGPDNYTPFAEILHDK